MESIENRYISDHKCPECSQEVSIIRFNYCKPCNSTHFSNKFAHWTSGDMKVNELIQHSQLNANNQHELIEWIKYSNLENVEFVAHGGFGSVYKAIWKDGPINFVDPWNFNKSGWNRDSNKEVAIKKLNATKVSLEFLNEVKNNLMLNCTSYCNNIYGVTRDPSDDKYAIVIQFQKDGSMREFIKKNYSILNWKSVIDILNNICNGLGDLHDKNYHHRDFHSGNILNEIFDNGIMSVISDFGLCCPADQISTDKKLYGVLPFVAPEVLRGEEFTKAADIYGFGMLMSEIISGEAPFVNRDYDIHLTLDICDGERPPIPKYTPVLYADLMKRCWDSNPANRPTAYELSLQIGNWMILICKYELDDSQPAIRQEFEKEFSQEREDRWKARLAELATNPCPLKKSQNMLTRKELDYSKQLIQSLEAKETIDDIYVTRQVDMSL